jgi:hypothetical protein
MHFEEAYEFEGDASEVWKKASAIRDIPSYWHGTRSLVVVGEGGGMTHVKVRFAFGGSGEANISIDEKGRTMTIDYVSGPFTGRQTVTVSGERVAATWDVKFRGIYRIASKWNEGHFRSGTVHALERLAGRG